MGEGQGRDSALQWTEGRLKEEVESYSSVRDLPEDDHFILLVRTLDGKVEGLGLSNLIRSGSRVFMRCDRDCKLDLNSETSIHDVGIALLISRFLFMKRQDYWYPQAALLTHYDPIVADKYRVRAGLTTRIFFFYDTASFSTEEGEQLLKKPPVQFKKL